MSFSPVYDCDFLFVVCTWNLDFVWTSLSGMYRPWEIVFPFKKGINNLLLHHL